MTASSTKFRSKFKLFAILLLFIIAIAILIGPSYVRGRKALNVFKEKIDILLSEYPFVDHFKLQGDYKNHLRIYVNNQFNDLHYNDIVSFLDNVDSEFSDFYTEYVHSLAEFRSINIYSFDYAHSEKIICPDNTVYEDGHPLLRDYKPFTLTDYYTEYFSKNFSLSESSLDMLLKLDPDAVDDLIKSTTPSTCEKDIEYSYAEKLYSDGKFEKAKDAFLKLNNYKDSNGYLSNIESLMRLQGVWKRTEHNIYQIIFDGWNVYLKGSYLASAGEFSFISPDKFLLTVPSGTAIPNVEVCIENGTLYIIDKYGALKAFAEKINDKNIYKADLPYDEFPTVGMREDDLYKLLGRPHKSEKCLDFDVLRIENKYKVCTWGSFPNPGFCQVHINYRYHWGSKYDEYIDYPISNGYVSNVTYVDEYGNYVSNP